MTHDEALKLKKKKPSTELPNPTVNFMWGILREGNIGAGEGGF